LGRSRTASCPIDAAELAREARDSREPRPRPVAEAAHEAGPRPRARRRRSCVTVRRRAPQLCECLHDRRRRGTERDSEMRGYFLIREAEVVASHNELALPRGEYPKKVENDQTLEARRGHRAGRESQGREQTLLPRRAAKRANTDDTEPRIETSDIADALLQRCQDRLLYRVFRSFA